MKQNKFIHIPFSREHLDIYLVRTSILNSINQSLPLLNGHLIDIGCGKMPYKEYILSGANVTSYTGLDIEGALVYDNHVRPDYTWDGITMPFADMKFDCALGTEVLEHCPDPSIVLKEVFRVLKKDGAFFFTVPFLWPLHEVPHDEFRYTPYSLTRLLQNAGFKDIRINAMGGWHAALAQMLGLWVRRAPMSETKRKILSRILMPVISFLIKHDAHYSKDFRESLMITGLYGVARK